MSKDTTNRTTNKQKPRQPKERLGTLQLDGVVSVGVNMTQCDFYPPGNAACWRVVRIQFGRLPELLDMPKPDACHLVIYICVLVCECLLMPSLHVPPHSQKEAQRLLWVCRTACTSSDWGFLSASDEAYICSCACPGSITVGHSRSAVRVKDTESTSINRGNIHIAGHVGFISSCCTGLHSQACQLGFGLTKHAEHEQMRDQQPQTTCCGV